MGKRIPISAAKQIAQKYDYEQVVILARKTGPDGQSRITSYGVTQVHCDAAKKVGKALHDLESGRRMLILRPDRLPEQSV